MGVNLEALIRKAFQGSVADLFLLAGSPPAVREEGVVRLLEDHPPLRPADTEELARQALGEMGWQRFCEEREANLALAVEGFGRFRINVLWQRSSVGLVLRRIRSQLPTFQELRLPELLRQLSLEKRGLVLVVGGAGMGKSTTLAAMVGYRSQELPGHIVTVEDPIEFLHDHRRSLVTQREVGIDTPTFASALRNALRQAPDVIVIGEIRTPEVMDLAISFADTGHLCLGTMHANSTVEAVERIMDFFPPERHLQVRLQLSLNLKAIIAQRLVRSREERLVPAIEMLLGTARVREMLRRGETHRLREAMAEDDLMQTFDQSLYQLYREGHIDLETALAAADSPTDLRLRIKMEDLGERVKG